MRSKRHRNPQLLVGFLGLHIRLSILHFHRLPPINYCTRKLKSIAGNDVSKKPFTSTEETPKVSAFLFDFGKGSVVLPSHSLSTQLCQGDTSYPSREPTAKKKKDAWSKSCRIARRQQSDPVILRSHLGNVMIDINVRWWYHNRGCGTTILKPLLP